MHLVLFEDVHKSIEGVILIKRYKFKVYQVWMQVDSYKKGCISNRYHYQVLFDKYYNNEELKHHLEQKSIISV